MFRLRDKVGDGPIVEPAIKSSRDEIDFLISADNYTDQQPEAHSAQPRLRLGDFTGFPGQGDDLNDCLGKCFLFLKGKLVRMTEVKPWAMKTRDTQVQVWCPEGVPRKDVNP